MEIKFDDILKNIFPGLLILCSIFFLSTGLVPFHDDLTSVLDPWKDFSEILLTGILIISYFLGYFNEMVASWVEKGLFFLIFSRPTFNLLKGRTWRIKLHDKEEIFNKFKNITKNIEGDSCKNVTREDAKKIFQKAKELVDQKADEIIREKYENFYKAYNFSRNILVATILIFSTFLFTKESLSWNWFTMKIIFALITIMLIIRWAERGLYYSRLVLTSASTYTDEKSVNVTEANVILAKAQKEAISAEMSAIKSKQEFDKLKAMSDKLQEIVDSVKQ